MDRMMSHSSESYGGSPAAARRRAEALADGLRDEY